MNKLNKLVILIIAILTLVLMSTSCTNKENDDNVVDIIHKNFTEHRILSQMLSLYLENIGYETSVSEVTGSILPFEAMVNREADIYLSYTGTAYTAILGETEILSADETYNFVKNAYEEQFGLTWGKDLGFNNTYILSMSKEKAEQYGIEKTSDLIQYSGDMVLGCDMEFANREDGLTGLMETYDGLEFADVKSMEQGLTYKAVSDGELDVIASYSTDGRIEKFGLVNLEDDKNYFPPYYVAPVYDIEEGKKNPEIVQALEKLANQWTEEEMQKYNLMVDEGENPRDVATIMLKEKGLLD